MYVYSAEDEDEDAAVDGQERLSFKLLRRNALQQLGTTVCITMEHKLATVLHPTYRHLRMLPLAERNQVITLTYCLSVYFCAPVS